MSNPSFIFSFQEKQLAEYSKKYQIIHNVKELYLSSDIDKVKKHSDVVTKIFFTCFITLILSIGIFLAIVTPCILSLGPTSIFISSISIISVFLLLYMGAGLIFFHLHKKKDIFLETPLDPCLERVLVNTETLVFSPKRHKYECYSCFLDISTLDSKGNGNVFGYFHVNEEDFHTSRGFRLVSILAILILPFITLAAILYNFIRMIVVPFYVLSQIIKKTHLFQEERFNKELSFKISDVFLEMFFSLKRAVKAPFYSTAMFFSLVYSLIFLRSGRIITGRIERAWNEQVYLTFGCHLWRKLKLWSWEGGGKPKQLGRNGYYIAGCMQPRYVFEIKEWTIVSGKQIFNKDLSLERDENEACIINRIEEEEEEEEIET